MHWQVPAIGVVVLGAFALGWWEGVAPHQLPTEMKWLLVALIGLATVLMLHPGRGVTEDPEELESGDN